jgi:protein-tyrosine phosphatase
MTDLTMSPEELAKRHLPLTGTYNLRDVGGYLTKDGRVTRWQVLLRADALHKLDTDGHSVLAGLGLCTVIDLRENEELDHAPDQLGVLQVQTLHHPLFDRPTSGIASTATARRSLAETYLLVVDERADAIVGVVRAIAADNVTPAIVHCTAGKDRTGMVIALVLSAVGVEEELIVQDFAVTGQLLSGAFRDEVLARVSERGIPIAEIEPMLSADPQLIRSFLDRISELHGDTESFLLAHGMTPDELESLRSKLLVEPSVVREDQMTKSEVAHA